MTQHTTDNLHALIDRISVATAKSPILVFRLSNGMLEGTFKTVGSMQRKGKNPGAFVGEFHGRMSRIDMRDLFTDILKEEEGDHAGV